MLIMSLEVRTRTEKDTSFSINTQKENFKLNEGEKGNKVENVSPMFVLLFFLRIRGDLIGINYASPRL